MRGRWSLGPAGVLLSAMSALLLVSLTAVQACTTNSDCQTSAAGPCKIWVCLAEGSCFLEDLADGTACGDNLYCTGSGGACQSGVCVESGDPCVSGDVCKNQCNEAAQNCLSISGTSCDDGLFCSGADTCDGMGNCVSAGDPCPLSVSEPECGLHVCNEESNSCDHKASGTSCTNDGSFCTGVETCDGQGSCLSAGDPCSGGITCNNRCNETGVNCYTSALTTCTDDFNPCTDDLCDGTGSCAHTPAPDGTSCSDGIPCTNPDTCQAGTCVPGPSICGCQANSDCDDNNTCTVDICTVNNFNGTCSFATVANNTLCNDSIWCNGDNDICIAGTCVGEFSLPLTRCSGGAPCNDTCSEAMNLCMSPNGTSCSNGFFCDGEELCLSGSCAPGSPPCAGGCDEVEGICRTTSGPVSSSGLSWTSAYLMSNSTLSSTTSNADSSSTTVTTESSSTSTAAEPGVSGRSANFGMMGVVFGVVGGVLLITAGVVAAVIVRQRKPSTSLPSSVSDAELSSLNGQSESVYAKSPSSLGDGNTVTYAKTPGDTQTYAKTPSASVDVADFVESTYAKTPATESTYSKTPATATKRGSP